MRSVRLIVRTGLRGGSCQASKPGDDMSDGPVDRVGDGTAYVCEHLADIRAQLERSGNADPLELLLSAARADRDVAGALDALHHALQAAGDALGVYGNLRSGIPRTLGDFGTARPREPLYLCPRRRCARYRWPDHESTAPPTCGIDGEPMVEG